MRASYGATALSDMSQSLSGFGHAITAALSKPPAGIDPTPVRKTDAVKALLRQEKEWLNTVQLVTFIDFIRTDKSAADIYLALVEEEVRREWVYTQLEKIQ